MGGAAILGLAPSSTPRPTSAYRRQELGLHTALLRGGRCPRCPRRPRRDRARRCFHCLSSRTARCRPRPRTASFPRGRLPCQQSRRTRGQQHCQQGNRWRGSPWRPASRPRLRSMRQRSPPKGKDPTSSSTRHCPREKRRAGTTSRLLTHHPRRRLPGLLRSPYRISTRHRRRQCHRRRPGAVRPRLAGRRCGLRSFSWGRGLGGGGGGGGGGEHVLRATHAWA